MAFERQKTQRSFRPYDVQRRQFRGHNGLSPLMGNDHVIRTILPVQALSLLEQRQIHWTQIATYTEI